MFIQGGSWDKNLKSITKTDRGYNVNGAPKPGVLKNGLIALWKIIPSDARNSVYGVFFLELSELHDLPLKFIFFFHVEFQKWEKQKCELCH